MKTSQWLFRTLLPASLSLLCVAAGLGQTIFQIDAKETSLADRWELAKANAGSRHFERGYWIGYSIQRLMGERSFIGSYYSESRRNHPSLGELITGMKQELETPDVSIGRTTSMSGMMSFNEGDKPEHNIIKEVALLFHLEGTRSLAVTDLEVSNLSLHVDLGDEPLIWIGSAGHTESVSFLKKVYAQAGPTELKKHLMMAIGLHEDTNEAIEFLKTILQSSEHSGVREDAAFWLGQTGTSDALKILTGTARNDRSDGVRDKAMFAISQIAGEASTDVLIDLAKSHTDRETRKKAAFWLGQKASEKAIGALKDLAYKDEDTEVQRNAIFALTQIDHGEGGVDELIRIATTHSNPRIRKEAIFWLGQSENPKALDALIGIVKK